MAKKARQLTLPGMKAPARVKPTSESPKSSGKYLDKFVKRDKLRSEMLAGNRPMFMTASEIVRLGNLSDAGFRNEAPLHLPKSRKQKNAEQNVMSNKLKESKTGTTISSHTKKQYQTGWTFIDGKEAKVSELPSLHESIAKEGYRGSFPIQETEYRVGRLGDPLKPENYLNVFEGHHRLAAMRNLHPKQFLPIEWHK